MPRFSANLSMLFTEHDFIDRFEKAHELGFKGVEYLFPYDFEPALIIEKLEEFNLEQVLFNLPAGNWNTGERGIACHPDRVEEFQQGVEEAIFYAKKIGCKKVNCLAGIKPHNVIYEKAYEVLINNLEFASKKLKENNIELVIESINTRDIPEFMITNTCQVLKIIRDVGIDNVYYQYDVYHMQIMEGDLINTIVKNKNIISHIQIADNPGRHEPGTGEINYDFILNFIDEINYKGWVGCEYIPSSNSTDSLNWMKKYS